MLLRISSYFDIEIDGWFAEDVRPGTYNFPRGYRHTALTPSLACPLSYDSYESFTDEFL
jgi:hypothetical protein